MAMPADQPELLRRLRPAADDEGLLVWIDKHVADMLGTSSRDARLLMGHASESGLVLRYLAGRPRAKLAYLIGAERPGGGSLLPPPSIQSGATIQAYVRRDSATCHLCGRPTTTAWNRPREWPSLDHLTPRCHGGSDYPTNLRTAHRSCNHARRDRPVAEFRGSPVTRYAVSGTTKRSVC